MWPTNERPPANVQRSGRVGGGEGSGSSRTNAPRGESRGPLCEPPRLLFFSPRALFVCAQEPFKDPAQSCATFEVQQRSVRKSGGRKGSGFSRWNSGSRRWNEPLLKKPPRTVGEGFFLLLFYFEPVRFRWRDDVRVAGGILPRRTDCDGFAKPGFHAALPGCPTPTRGPDRSPSASE